jgi:2,4-diketo-3-deoxy-L-fuconate hydrolase
MQQFARVHTDKGVVPVMLKGQQPLDLRPIVSDITAGALPAAHWPTSTHPVSRPLPARSPILRQSRAFARSPRPASTIGSTIEEFHMKPPTEPEVFLKGIGSLAGPFDPISRGPNKGVKLDWETELTVVIGRETNDITTAEAAAHVFGYVCLNDISDRATQVDAEGQQHLVRAKSRPTYCPIGPYLATGVDGMNLNIWTKLNGQFEQPGNTNDMLFNVYEMVAYFSTHMVLYPGDLLATGTPPGVGFGKNKFMAVGDVLECGIEHLGAQRHEIRA